MSVSPPSVGIISYGVAIPAFRITVEEIANAWQKDPEQLQKSLGITEKSVADVDEDAATLAIEAAQRGLGDIDPQNIGALYIGSESHPYAVKPTSSIVGNALGIGPHYFAADLEFACKAGTAAMQIVSSMIQSGNITSGIAIGSDTAQSAPGDILEYTAAAGAAAYIMGDKEEKIIARLDDTYSYTTDTPDFWRAKQEEYPAHAGRFTGEPGYFHHVVSATENFLERVKRNMSDFDHVVFHMPNGNFPERAAKKLGVTKEQLQTGLIVSKIGNTYSASSLLGLANVLDHAQPSETILLTSYGSGAGADCFAFTVTDQIAKWKPSATVQSLIKQKQYVSYQEYLQMRGKIETGKSEKK